MYARSIYRKHLFCNSPIGESRHDVDYFHDFKISSIAIPIFAAGYLLTVFKRFKKEGIGHARMGEKGANVKAELLYIDIVRKVEKMGDSCFAIARQLCGTI